MSLHKLLFQLGAVAILFIGLLDPFSAYATVHYSNLGCGTILNGYSGGYTYFDINGDGINDFVLYARIQTQYDPTTNDSITLPAEDHH